MAVISAAASQPYWFDLRRRWIDLAVHAYRKSFYDEWTARRWAAGEWEFGWPKPENKS